MRNKYFATAQAVAQENAKAGGPLMGTLFWHWCVRVMDVAARLRFAYGALSILPPARYDEGMGPGQYGGACSRAPRALASCGGSAHAGR